MLVLRLMDPLEAEISCIWTERKETNHEKKIWAESEKGFFLFPKPNFEMIFDLCFFLFQSNSEHAPFIFKPGWYNFVTVIQIFMIFT